MEKIALYDGRTGETFDNPITVGVYVHVKTSPLS